MRIVFVLDWYSEKTGYSFNFLPKELASLGHEVHVVTSDGQVYFTSPVYKEIFESFLGPAIVKPVVKKVDGYILHRLPHKILRGRIHLKGLFKKLHSLRPQIVQAGEAITLLTHEAALFKAFLGYKFFMECHVHASVFSPYAQGTKIKERFYWLFYPLTIGRFTSFMSERCYPISVDAADVAVRFLGVQKHKITIRSLGVDADLFKPISDEAPRQVRLNIRKQFGFSDSDIVCIYTGRFGQIKNPLCLAHAIESLVAQGRPFKGLFIGNGNHLDIDVLRSCKGCVVHSYVPVQELVKFYWASDIGVWPKHESTSQLDAMACGLPLILSNRIKVYERIDGNGLLYEEDNVEDLSHKLSTLANTEMRQRMGKHGAKKIAECFSWKSIAERYIQDYETALKH